ncbi:hypothetical protein DL96DRAFT_1625702 [Flagelloscypha sp. PMI_526]|nr:hypothetical protein DL96DRAFT_1625702 [Flagelloscypha sp. PMI_526]
MTMNPFISCIPSELLFLIFESVCKDNRIELESRLLSKIPALSLSHVCRSFRSLATSSYRLWSNVTIHMGMGFSYSSPSKISESHLMMIQNDLLPMFYKCLDGHPVCMTLMSVASWKPSLELSYLFPASWTISSLTMTEVVYEGIINNNIHLDEHITSLRIVETIYGNSWSDFFPHAQFAHLCNLEDVDTGPLDLKKFDLPWHQLRVVRFPADLKSLTFLASRCPRLTSLTLNKKKGKRSSKFHDKVTLQTLIELHLWLFPDCPELLKYLHTPALTKLSVFGHKKYPKVWPAAYNRLLEFLQWSSPALQTFKLQDTLCSVPELIDLVGRMPHLRNPHFRPTLDKEDIHTNFHDLATFLADSLNIPELTHLEVHGLPESSSINSLIRSIKQRKSVEGDVLRVVWVRAAKDFLLDEPPECLIYEMNHSGFFIMIESEEEGE